MSLVHSALTPLLHRHAIIETIQDCWVNHYVGLFWSSLEERGLETYYIALGWSVESWEGGAEKPATEDLYWDELSLDQQNAATNLCYFKNLWNQDLIGDWQFDVDEMRYAGRPNEQSDSSATTNGTEAPSQHPVSSSTATQSYGAEFPEVRFVSLACAFESFCSLKTKLIVSRSQSDWRSLIAADRTTANDKLGYERFVSGTCMTAILLTFSSLSS